MKRHIATQLASPIEIAVVAVIGKTRPDIPGPRPQLHPVMFKFRITSDPLIDASRRGGKSEREMNFVPFFFIQFEEAAHKNIADPTRGVVGICAVARMTAATRVG